LYNSNFRRKLNSIIIDICYNDGFTASVKNNKTIRLWKRETCGNLVTTGGLLAQWSLQRWLTACYLGGRSGPVNLVDKSFI